MHPWADRALVICCMVAAALGTGCVTTAQVGTRTVGQTAPPSVAQDGNVEVGAGLGDASISMMVVANGGVGGNVSTGKAEGTFMGGLEFLKFDGTPETSNHGNHIAILTGLRTPFENGDPGGIFLFRYGHAFVLGVSGSERSAASASSLSLDVLAGMTFGETTLSGTLGLGLTFRYDSFSEWHFKF